MNFVEKSFEYAECVEIVTQYLLGQGWKLVPPEALAMQVWQALNTKIQTKTEAIKQVQSLVWQHYAVLLHDHCRQASDVSSSQAWSELRLWLEKQTLRLNPDLREREDIIQETLLQLHLQLNKTPIESPRAFLVYVLQVFKGKNVDYHRRKTAVKRGEENTVYLEDGIPASSQNKDTNWEDRFKSVEENEDRIVENAIADEDVRSQIRTFFRTYISSPLQLQVAEAHFLDGLSPVEIARLLNKQPHEIRMAKARVVNTLRNLSPDVRAKLLEILGSL